MIHWFLIRLGIAVVVLLLGGFGGRELIASSSPNQRYFNELADVWNRTDGLDKAQMLRRLRALPSSGVTDPKLQEAQGILVDLCSLPPPPLDEATKSRVLTEIGRLDRLQDELNAKYANK